MKYKMLLIEAPSQATFIELEKRPSFSDMQKLVGGYVERTYSLRITDRRGPEDPEKCVLLAGSQSRKQLPVNEWAARYLPTTIVGSVLVLQNFDLESE